MPRTLLPACRPLLALEDRVDRRIVGLDARSDALKGRLLGLDERRRCPLARRDGLRPQQRPPVGIDDRRIPLAGRENRRAELADEPRLADQHAPQLVRVLVDYGTAGGVTVDSG